MSVYLRKLKPRDLTVAVLDHDYWIGAEKVRRIMKARANEKIMGAEKVYHIFKSKINDVTLNKNASK